MPERQPCIRGVLPALATPLVDGGIDEVSLRRAIELQVEAGVDGLFVLGTGGEGPYLTAGQRRQVLGVIARQIAGRVPFFVATSDVGTARVIEAIRDAEVAGAAGVAATPSFYADNGQAEIVTHFRALRAATDLPVIAYDIPRIVGAKMSAATTIQLAHEGVIAGVKDTSGDEDGFRQIIVGTRDLPHFGVITGSDTISDAALFQGADGMIVGLGNVDPHGYVRLQQAFARSDWETVRHEMARYLRLRDIRTVALPRIGWFSSFIAGTKAAMVHRGVIASDEVFSPLVRLSNRERARVAAICDELELGPVG